MNFDLKKIYKNEFKDNNEKSCSWSRKTVSQKIDLKAVWPRNGDADSVGVSIIIFYLKHYSTQDCSFSRIIFPCWFGSIWSGLGQKSFVSFHET